MSFMHQTFDKELRPFLSVTGVHFFSARAATQDEMVKTSKQSLMVGLLTSEMTNKRRKYSL